MTWNLPTSAPELSTTQSSSPEYDERYLEYIELFNERYFYDCHEVLEDLWLDNADDSRRFYQGLIHLATAYQHLFRGNMRGSRQRFASTLAYLSGYPDIYEGLGLRPIRDNIKFWQLRIADAEPSPASYHDQDVPTLCLISRKRNS